MGNPLASVAGFYGHTGTAPSDYWKIDWENSDCGYGVGQVTDGHWVRFPPATRPSSIPVKDKGQESSS
jgi:hypothetical protein